MVTSVQNAPKGTPADVNPDIGAAPLTSVALRSALDGANPSEAFATPEG